MPRTIMRHVRLHSAARRQFWITAVRGPRCVARHADCSQRCQRLLVRAARAMPRSVMIAVTYFAGVTSNAGLRMRAPSGVSRDDPTCVTSRSLRSSIGIRLPSGVFEIDRRERRGDVERNAVLPGQHRHAVGADLVRHVAVGGDAVGADDDQVDLAEPHHRAGHVVGDDRRVDAVLDQLPRGQPRALQKRPRLVGEHGDLLALLGGRANHAERGAVAGRRQRAGVAVRQDAAPSRAPAPRRARPSPGSSATSSS